MTTAPPPPPAWDDNDGYHQDPNWLPTEIQQPAAPGDDVDPADVIFNTWNSALRSLHHAYQERPPTKFVVDKFVAEGALIIVYGAPGTLKSMLIADMALCVAAGSDWLPGSRPNGKGVPTTQAPVLWLDLDNGKKRTDERIDAIAKKKGLPVDAPVHYLTMPVPTIVASDVNTMVAVIQLVRHTGARLVVLDNLGLVTGDIDENSTEMSVVMSYLRAITEATNAAVIVIHHQRKGGQGQSSRSGDALRGSGSIEAAIDLALLVTREEVNDPTISVKSTKTRGTPVPKVWGQFNYSHVPGTEDLETAWFSGLQDDSKSSKVFTVEGLEAEILATVDLYGTPTIGKLVPLVAQNMRDAGTTVSERMVKGTVEDMIAHGLLNVTTIGRAKQITIKKKYSGGN